MARKRTTLAQVALRAGVSKTTASYVLNRTREMSAETTDRVMHAAKELGYRLDSRASGLRRGQTDVVGVITVGNAVDMVVLHNSIFWPRFADSLVQRCSEAHVVVAFADELTAQPLLDSGVDALLVLGLHTEEVFASLRVPFGLPTLSLAPVTGFETHVMEHDASAIAKVVVEHLQSQGATRLSWLTISSVAKILGNWARELRFAANEQGLGFSSHVYDGSTEALNDIVADELSEGTDAFFALTAGTKSLIDAVERCGRTVPDDVLVVVQAEGLVEEAMTPTVSYLSLLGAQSGAAVADVAYALIHGDPPPTTSMPFSLTIRSSSIRS